MTTLFADSEGKHYTAEDISSALKSIGTQECDALFIHSDIMFGKTVEGFNRKEYLDTLYDVFRELGVKYLIAPVFTYSFCNHEDYDVKKSRTSMGSFNEYIRKKDGRYRTLDPLLSLSVPEELKYRFQKLGVHSLGENSGLDVIHNMGNVKFLFFGARMGNCFTYVHYVEKMLDVPYRFDMPFSGNVIDEDGKTDQCTQYMHTACYGVRPADFYYFEDELEEKGFLKKRPLGDKTISCISEKDAYREIVQKLQKDINYFLEVPFKPEDLIHKYTKGLNGERITHC